VDNAFALLLYPPVFYFCTKVIVCSNQAPLFLGGKSGSNRIKK